MSADLLRRAAAAMRERAEAAAGLGIAGEWWQEHALTWLARTTGVPPLAEHIASWHPAVALAVADWLDREGWAWQETVRTHPDLAEVAEQQIADSQALAVARAYLGEAS